MHTRRDVARLLGAPSFAHHQLQGGLLAARPEAAAQFLDGFSDALRPLVGPCPPLWALAIPMFRQLLAALGQGGCTHMQPRVRHAQQALHIFVLRSPAGAVRHLRGVRDCQARSNECHFTVSCWRCCRGCQNSRPTCGGADTHVAEAGSAMQHTAVLRHRLERGCCSCVRHTLWCVAGSADRA